MKKPNLEKVTTPKESKLPQFTQENALQAIHEQSAKRITVRLDENCIETIKRLTPEGGEEIDFHGIIGGIKLIWVGKATTQLPSWREPSTPGETETEKEYALRCIRGWGENKTAENTAFYLKAIDFLTQRLDPNLRKAGYNGCGAANVLMRNYPSQEEKK